MWIRYAYPDLTADRHKSYMTSSESRDCPSDKKMTIGVLNPESLALNWVSWSTFTFVHSIAAPLLCVRWQGPCRSLYRPTKGCVQSTFPPAHLGCLCYRFPKEPSHHSQYMPITIATKYLGGAAKEHNAICILSNTRGCSLSCCHLS